MIAPDLDEKVDAAARVFLESGRFVPGLAVGEEGRGRSWWWPLPAAGDRELIASLCADSSVEAQRDVASRLEAAVDARAGQVLSFDVRPGMLVAQVQGSRPTPYVVTAAATSPTVEQWAGVDRALAARVGFVARLLAGEVPPDLEAVFHDASVELFPVSWSTLDARCSCPDRENPCKHIAAVLYVFADQLDDDPWLLLAWRGRTRDQLLGPLRARTGAVPPTGDSVVAPWWPFGDGARLPVGLRADGAIVEPPDPPDGVLRRLASLDVDVRGEPVCDLLPAAYEVVCVRETDAGG